MNKIKCFCNRSIFNANKWYAYCNSCRILFSSLEEKDIVIYFFNDMTIDITDGIAKVDVYGKNGQFIFNINAGPKEVIFNKIKTYMLFI